MKRLICQSLYSNIGKDLALHGPRTIVKANSDVAVYRYEYDVRSMVLSS